jgi:hypothetical protein
VARAGSSPVTLEILLAPGDVRHAVEVLPHQLRVWAGQVDEIVCTIDTLSSFGEPVRRGSPALRELVDLVDSCLAPYPHGRRAMVDFSGEALRGVGDEFFGGKRPPPKDFRGFGFYSYFFGLHEARHDHVLHMDSDMLFGGGSHTWLAEALELLAQRPDVLSCSPLPAPPTPDGDLRVKKKLPPREPYASIAYRWDSTFSTRCCLLDRRRLAERIGALELVPYRSARERVPVRQWLAALPTWNLSDLRRPLTLRLPPYHFAEVALAEGMSRAGLYRVEFLGEEPGMWMLHPGLRTERVYEVLPALVDCVERGAIPDEQRGYWDLADATVEAIRSGATAAGRM